MSGSLRIRATDSDDRSTYTGWSSALAKTPPLVTYERWFPSNHLSYVEFDLVLLSLDFLLLLCRLQLSRPGRNKIQSVPKIAIIAALERELWPLIKNWPPSVARHEGREFTFYESNYAVVVCGGIGPESARRAAEAIIARYSPEVLISAGVAGALVSELRVGETVFPEAVIDTLDGSRHETAITDAPVAKTALGRTVLASSPEIAGVRQKQQLAKSYGAQAVDMEAAAIAKAAMFHNLPFLAIKSISDELGFEMPEMARFIRSGQFRTGRFAFHVALRPWLWLRVYRLARNTRVASDNLCAWLRESALTNTIITKLNH